ncbi:POL3-like protein [Mya arenaria]|uniref:POL3-like protein n=1 Tax=Mya arenaria TaxID=6604 RepID=A0ABY7FXS3_MYAAR|nr:POL3-like protein [Mya arenaria]
MGTLISENGMKPDPEKIKSITEKPPPEDKKGPAMETMKTILTSQPVLKFYDLNKDVTVQTDSSQHGIGCCLMQDGHVIAYGSRSLT